MRVEAGAYPTSASVVEAVEQSGKPYEVLAHTIYDLPIHCIRIGGNKEPAILITAGAHAGEPAGVIAALNLIETLETEHITYVVPLRDPFAWNSYARCLEYALGQRVEIESHAQVEELLSRHGRVVHREDEHNLIIAFVGDLVFVSMRPPPNSAGPRDIERRMNRVLRENPELITVLQGKRLLCPSNLTGVEGCGDFERGFSAIATASGVVADMNRQFTFAYPATEVACIRTLAARIKPALVLDLHEGQGNKFYLFTGSRSFSETDPGVEIARAILAGAIERSGGELLRLAELLPRLDPLMTAQFAEPIPGLIVGAGNYVQQGFGFQSYCQRYGPSFSFEPGRWKSLSIRVEEEIGGALRGIEVFEKQHA